MAGPIGWVAGAGALVGGIAARRDSGFNERLERLGEALTPGTSAIVAVVEHTWVAELEAELREANADVTTEEIAADIAAHLEAGGEVSYTAAESDEGAVAVREASTARSADMEFVAATDEGVVAGGVSVEAADAGDEGDDDSDHSKNGEDGAG